MRSGSASRRGDPLYLAVLPIGTLASILRVSRIPIDVTLNVVIEHEDDWFVAEVPALPGCISQGRSREEALANVKEAIEGWLLVERDKHRLPARAEVVPLTI